MALLGWRQQWNGRRTRSSGVPLAALIPSARNARTHSDAQIAQIAASIREWGWTMPILVDEAGTIIAGHGRVLAAARLGLDAVPVMVARGWTEAQKRAYLIADNKLGLNAGWDEELLRIEMADLMTMGFELPLIGFSERELSALNASGNPGLTDPDEAPDAPAVPVTRPGDVWMLGRHRLLCGDATSETDVALCLGAVRPHLMVTDPPYGVDYDPKWRAYADVNKNRGKLGKVANDDRADWREAWALFPGDVAYCWHAGKHASTVQASLEAAGFEVRAQIIWAKDRFALSRGDYHWQHEPCWYAVRKGAGGHWPGDRNQTTLWQIPAREDSGHGHGTQKPVECMKRPIENNSLARPGGLRSVCRLGHHDHRGRDDRPRLSRHRDRSGLRRRRGAALAGLHRRAGDARRWPQLRGGRGRAGEARRR